MFVTSLPGLWTYLMDRDRQSIGYKWRLLGTAVGYFVFAVFGGVVAPAAALLLWILPAGKNHKQIAMRWLIYMASRVYILLISLLGVISYEITGYENVRQSSQLIVANHPTLIDVLFILSLVRNGICIVREKLWSNPFMSVAIRAAGYIRNDDQLLLEKAVSMLEGGNNLILFPEGTRSGDTEQFNKFRRGAASIALKAKVNMTPVVIMCNPPYLKKKQKWFRIPDSPPHYRIYVLTDVITDQIVGRDLIRPKAARVLTGHLENVFSEVLLSRNL